MTRQLFLLCTAFLCLTFNARSQTTASKAHRQSIDLALDSMANMLRRAYVHASKAEQLYSHLNNAKTRIKYYKTKNQQEFADVVTGDLQTLSKDKHLSVEHNPSWLSSRAHTTTKDSIVHHEYTRLYHSKTNYGMQKIEMLTGNIGYYKFNMFAPPHDAGTKITAAMAFLAHSDAIIIDLRDNGGGESQTIRLLASYFFDREVHLNNFHHREDNKTYQEWSAPYMLENRMPDTPLYILIGEKTFSAAEAFAYVMQRTKRATIIGTASKGGAHAVSVRPLNESIFLRLPYLEAIDPETGGNWEGSGVIPDLIVPTNKALYEAKRVALNKLAVTDTTQLLNYKYASTKLRLETTIKEVTPNLNRFVGNYGEVVLKLSNGKVIQAFEGQDFPMVYEGNGLFSVPGYPDYLLEIKEENGTILGCTSHYERDPSEYHEKLTK